MVAVLALAGMALALVPVPKLTGRVNDTAGILDGSQRDRIEQALADFERQTTTQIALLTVPSLDGEDIAAFGIRVGDAWKIGQADKDNGAILIVAPKDRKVRIEVGYGLEGALTDAESSQIIRNVIVPAFRDGNWYGGISGGLDAMMRATKGEYTAPAGSDNPYRRAEKKQSVFSSIVAAIIFIVLISTPWGRSMLWFMMASSMMGGGRGGSRGGGGGFRGGGGGFGGGGASGSW
ncbi:MAG: YgcG family protein [Deltaproteobacteria bacterium]|nr:YgcG family protein [Deltaproteobacteria bacterium]